jgi:FkbH-like protein
MKLIDALEVLNGALAVDAPLFKVYLACGFTPLHLQTFLAAQLRIQLPYHRVAINTGLFGDLAGNIERLEPSHFNALVVVLEWEDLDPRLGIRRLGGWLPSNLSDIADSADQAAARLLRVILNVSRLVPTVVCMPTLPLPPLFWTPPDRTAPLELHLRQTVASLAASFSEQSNIQIANVQLLGEVSPPSDRFDPKSDVIAGFPYSLPHASALGGLLASLTYNRPPRKGLITDLDDTLWSGIVGEDGVNGISWHLESQTHMHGLFQQFVASLAGAGVLVGVASKNDSALVQQAFDRSDLLISKSDIFPFEVHWFPKSESVRRILETWNVGADSVVFIDDSPMEVAEVKASFPELECIVFPKGDYRRIWDLLQELRRFFGKPSLTEDDALRLSSIRNASGWRDSIRSTASTSDDFLRVAEASIVFSFTRECGDARAFELVNKTNQFNLNGKRLSESEWLNFFSDPAAFLLVVSYKDKYGPLGKIAVLMGKSNERKIHVQTWVMSCRAFSRRVEYQCLRYLFDDLDADTIVFDYQRTSRNGPLGEFFATLLKEPPAGEICISRELFFKGSPPLFHGITKAVHV